MQINTATSQYAPSPRLASAGELAQEVFDTLVYVLGGDPASALREARAVAREVRAAC